MFGLQDFSSVAEKTGTYTAFDYADIMDHLIKRWDVAGRRDLTGEVSSKRCSVVVKGSVFMSRQSAHVLQLYSNSWYPDTGWGDVFGVGANTHVNALRRCLQVALCLRHGSQHLLSRLLC